MSRRFALGAAGALAVAAAAMAGAGCSAHANDQIAFTKDAALVSSCQKLEDVSVAAKTPDDQINEQMANEARQKGGNYVLVTDGTRSGTVYRCAAPAVTTGAAATGR